MQYRRRLSFLNSFNWGVLRNCNIGDIICWEVFIDSHVRKVVWRRRMRIKEWILGFMQLWKVAKVVQLKPLEVSFELRALYNSWLKVPCRILYLACWHYFEGIGIAATIVGRGNVIDTRLADIWPELILMLRLGMSCYLVSATITVKLSS